MAGKSLKGTKSHTNLKEAFAGESQANRRYLYFARVADIEGFPDMAGLFQRTADAADGRALRPPHLPPNGGGPAPRGAGHAAGRPRPPGAAGLHGGRGGRCRVGGTGSLRPLACPRAASRHSATSTLMASLDLNSPEFWDRSAVDTELRRVYDIWGGCRRCLPLCPSFKVLFDRLDVDAVDGDVEKLPARDVKEVVDLCYQCKLCFNHCPYTPPHRWEVDFPRLMLRARAADARANGVSLQDRMLGNTELVGKLGRLAAPLSNWLNELAVHRAFMHAVAGIHKNRNLPKFHRQTFSAWFKSRARRGAIAGSASAAGGRTGGGAGDNVSGAGVPTGLGAAHYVSAAGVATARVAGNHVSAAGVPTGRGAGDHVSAAGVAPGPGPAAYKSAPFPTGPGGDNEPPTGRPALRRPQRDPARV